MFYIIKEDVNFHTFETLEEDNVTNVSKVVSFFNSSNNLVTLEWKQETIHQPCYELKLQMSQIRMNMNIVQSNNGSKIQP
jgi:hypothetical protein